MRVAICIGCDAYENSSQLGPLTGACRDARNVYARLIHKEVGAYDEESSLLLESPTLPEVNEALRAFTARAQGKVETFTFYFAGHGVQVAGGYYLCLRDTTEQYSTTALSMNQLFSVLNESQPLQSNIILDACMAGGVVLDLATLLKSDLIGAAGTQGVSILAGSALDRAALETCEGGFVTQALVRCIDGDLRVQDTRRTLDLIEIGRVVSGVVRDQTDQSPACWGLNLYGEGRFCFNPHGPSAADDADGSIIESVRYVASQTETIKKSAGAVWELYQKIPNAFDFRAAAGILGKIVDNLTADPLAMCGFVRGISETFGKAAADSDEVFRECEIHALCIVVLLPHSELEIVERTILELASRQLQSLRRALTETQNLLSKYPNFLASVDGTAGFFYLPIRLSALLGWLGVADRLGAWLGADEEPRIFGEFEPMIRTVTEHYATAIRLNSDVQAAYLAPFFSSAAERGVADIQEVTLGLLFRSLVLRKGRVLSDDADGRAAAIFVLGESELTGTFNKRDIARPASVLALLLVASRTLGLGEVLDEDMDQLDQHCMNLFIPDDYRRFGDAVVEGVNHTYEIGEGIWRVDDFLKHWDSIVAPTGLGAITTSIRIGALNASMLFPDRVCWFLFA